MRTTYAFFKKEWLEYYRSRKLIIIGSVFILFGIMNPAIAKLLPFILEKFAENGETGISVVLPSVDASMSWAQFYKNIPMALIVCVLMFGGILTGELQKGTLIPILTKGLARWKVLFTKGLNLIILWTAGYWVCYGITYFYTGYYWDNGVMSNLFPAAGLYWLYGTLIMTLIIFFSSFSSSFAGVILGVGGSYFVITLLGMIPRLSSYLPTKLTDVSGLLEGGNCEVFLIPAIISFVIIILCFIIGCAIFNKREV